MQCPKCQYNGSRVVDSRQTDDGQSIRRRRECEVCQYRFTTFERVEIIPLLVIKRNGTREEFSREKLLKGLIRSAEKRPVSMSQLENVVHYVEHELRKDGDSEVSSMLIGELVMDQLAQIDDISYIRFASVYRRFTDYKMFLQELEQMSKIRDEKK